MAQAVEAMKIVKAEIKLLKLKTKQCEDQKDDIDQALSSLQELLDSPEPVSAGCFLEHWDLNVQLAKEDQDGVEELKTKRKAVVARLQRLKKKTARKQSDKRKLKRKIAREQEVEAKLQEREICLLGIEIRRCKGWMNAIDWRLGGLRRQLDSMEPVSAGRLLECWDQYTELVDETQDKARKLEEEREGAVARLAELRQALARKQAAKRALARC